MKSHKINIHLTQSLAHSTFVHVFPIFCIHSQFIVANNGFECTSSDRENLCKSHVDAPNSKYGYFQSTGRFDLHLFSLGSFYLTLSVYEMQCTFWNILLLRWKLQIYANRLFYKINEHLHYLSFKYDLKYETLRKKPFLLIRSSVYTCSHWKSINQSQRLGVNMLENLFIYIPEDNCAAMFFLPK